MSETPTAESESTIRGQITPTMKTTVIHHSADYDGVFCREIASKFLPEAELIGWDFGQPKIEFPSEGKVYVLDLPPDCLQVMSDEQQSRLTWIDHHKSSIEKWKDFGFEGYRIDGVAACRLAWQWFAYHSIAAMPVKHDFIARKVREPLAVTLAGEYDVWQHENSNGEDITFQFGLDAEKSLRWGTLLADDHYSEYIQYLIEMGRAARECYRKRDADIATKRSFDLEFEGRKFIALNTARCNSQTFEAAVRPEHDGCFAFYWNGKSFIVSLYGVPHKPDVDLSLIAVKHGGGGHKQACGFQSSSLPFLESSGVPKV